MAVLQDDFIMRALSFGPGRRDAPDIDFQDLAGSLDVRTAVDDTGALHIAARNARFQDAELWYWRELDGGWRTVAGPRLADSVELGALAIGGVDGTLVRSSYSSYAFELNALEVATIGDGGWAAEIVVSESLPGAGSLEVDSGGSTHLGLIVSDPPDALYATDSSGEWAVESVLGPKEAPRPASLVLVLDAGEAPILLYAQEDGEVLQARHGSGRWELESVSHGVDVRSLAAAVDAADRLHGAFGARGGVLYFSGEPGSWATERISDVRALRVDIAAGSDGIHVLASAEAELQHLLLPAPDGVDGDCDGVVY